MSAEKSFVSIESLEHLRKTGVPMDPTTFVELVFLEFSIRVPPPWDYELFLNRVLACIEGLRPDQKVMWHMDPDRSMSMWTLTPKR